MNTQKELQKRSQGNCELCTNSDTLEIFDVSHSPSPDEAIHICNNCKSQLENPDSMEANHWRCLNDSMWSETPAVQVVSYRALNLLKSEDWARDLLDMMYLDEESMEWAKAGVESEDKVVHKDSNGAILQAGDSVVLIKDLNVKGANFTAKRGTAVRRISLVQDNAGHIEGRVNGQHIVILTQYVKKSK